MKKISIVIVVLLIAEVVSAQYFGRNKPRYRSFNFEVIESEHFDLHHYLENKDVAYQFAQMSERWYDYHKDIFMEDIPGKNPLILYNNHAEFQQTNSISGNIGVGTGGVTEAFKNRVVMPLTYSNQSTNQVLGHELVHAFQFNSIIGGDSTNLRSLGNLPLWLVEGMAEYMTLGRKDPFTAMWMRDAVLHDNVPEIRQMANPRYFPYRYGQAMWSFLTGVYGDGVMKPFFRSTAIYGMDYAVDSLFNMSTESLSNMWVNSLNTYYKPYVEGKPDPVGKRLFDRENAGRLNVSPSLSPNGRYVIFLSEKDLFSTDLYLADAHKGKIIRKVTSLVKDSDLDNLNYLESAGTWSPNGKKFAFVAFKKGENVLVIKEVESGKTLETISIGDLDALSSPTWSPDGRSIVVMSLVEGYPDLYQYEFRTKKVTRLTNDKYSEILPQFNADGTKLTFSYDKRSLDTGWPQGQITYDIAEMNLASGEITIHPVFQGAENINPVYDHEGNILFVSERDGYRNLYKYDLTTKEVTMMTDLATGISGISRYSPMISASQKRDKIIYTLYDNSGYVIYEGRASKMLNQKVDPNYIDQSAGTLPLVDKNPRKIVETNLDGAYDYALVDPSTMVEKGYSPKFKLDYVGGGTGIGVSNNALGNQTGAQGGVDLLFSDMLGNNQLFSSLVLNGDILDFGGQLAYLNRTNRIAWGIGVSHVPLRTGYQDFTRENVNTNVGVINAVVNNLNLIRVFDENISAFAHFPFSTTLRLEGGIGGNYRSFRQDQYKQYYQQVGNQYQYLGQERERISTGDELRLNQYYNIKKGFGGTANVALVGDNSYFGLTGPVAGGRFRIGVDQSIGNDNFTNITADLRKYWYLKPVTLAARTTNYVRFENETNSVFPFYVGNMGFVRGYGSAFSNNAVSELGLDFGQLLGSKIAMGSLEARLPFTGPKQLALIGSRTFLSDLVIFADAGVAFDNFSDVTDGKVFNTVVRDDNGQVVTDGNGNPLYSNQTLKQEIAASLGVSLRVNLFGAMIIEPYFAWPLSDGGRRTFGLNFIPGW